MLVLKHRTDSGQPAFQDAEPAHRFREAEAARADRSWSLSRRPTGERLAGVNSFGFGGANAHVILAEPPHRAARGSSAKSALDRAWPVVLSARSEEALRGYRR